jgi:serine/threonine protein kinase
MIHDLTKLDVIKQIGKGSFSNVYLCRRDCQNFFDSDDQGDFIIKEININSLVKNYVSNNTQDRIKHRFVDRKRVLYTVDVPLTPYQTNGQSNPVHKMFKAQETFSEDEYYYKRLKELIDSEIEVLSTLNHQNIIKFYDYQSSSGIYYLSMEYCELGDVHEALKNTERIADYDNARNQFNGMSMKFILDFIRQTCDGFVHLHNANIIHRDVKLHNILIKRDLTNGVSFKISDFGFSCYDLKNADEIDTDDVLTRKYFKLCGTPYYMAPEIIKNMHYLENFTKFNHDDKNTIELTHSGLDAEYKEKLFYGKSIDLWSFGVCIYELFFNSLPFPEIKNIQDLEVFYARSDVQDYINLKVYGNGTVPDIFRKLLHLLMQVNPTQRASITQVKAFIDDHSSELEKQCVASKTVYPISNNNETLKTQEFQFFKNVVSNPINQDLYETVSLSDSWEKVNKSSSLIMKMSVGKGFLDWLMNKT